MAVRARSQEVAAANCRGAASRSAPRMASLPCVRPNAPGTDHPRSSRPPAAGVWNPRARPRSV